MLVNKQLAAFATVMLSPAKWSCWRSFLQSACLPAPISPLVFGKFAIVFASTLMLSVLLAASPAGAADRASGDGGIVFAPCSLSHAQSPSTLQAQCGWLDVPEDRARPQGRQIRLHVARLAAREPAADDPVFFLAGGPGQAATAAYPLLDAAFAEVRRRRDIVLVDQRGTGRSNPLHCAQPDTDGVAKAVADEARACLRRLASSADPRHYTTSEAVVDLEAVREALGLERINLVGVSYGTRVAQQYAMRYPQHTRSLMLDSVVPNGLQLTRILARNLEDALALQFDVCAQDAACVEQLGEPRAQLQALLDQLRAQPLAVRYRDAASGELQQGMLDVETVTGLVRLFAYMPATSALLPKLIHDAVAGHPEHLMALAKMVEAQLRDSLAMGMQLSVVCSEDTLDAVAASTAAQTLLGSGTAEAMAAMCAVWPKGRLPADFHEPLSTDVPALLLAGEFDPVTPPRYGKDVVTHLPRGRLFVLRGQGHNVLGSGCVPRLLARFLETARADTLDGSCLDGLAPTPPFVNFNGAAP